MLSPDLLVRAYASGLFPMADPDDGTVGWYAPDPRAVLPLDDFHVPASLARVVRNGPFRVTTDTDFEGVMWACAEPAPGREETWISDDIVAGYAALHERGLAHSVEVRRAEDGALVGGLYGVALRGAFFGESMFHTARDASKVALVHLVGRLRAGGFTLLDVQFQTPHLARFGVVEVSRAVYLRRLAGALEVEADWHAADRQGGSATG
ncbi:MAG TPA: leucyl/phenylalanyl-tRNA--protein transferase [Rhodothermales bacterium]|nr:leucyl/phenylalanyl-tRNA--protein transferase [Rhodothermales bacterium]